MPISHEHQLIFVHIPKTGGSSVERALGIYGVQNAGNNTQVDESILFGKGLQHLTMREICQRVGEDISNRYFKFAFVRNPWARALSEYRWRRVWDTNVAHMSFADFVADELTNTRSYRHYWPQLDFIKDDSDGTGAKLAVDYVGRFENLSADFRDVVERCNLSGIILPHLNRAKIIDRARPVQSIKRWLTGTAARVKYSGRKLYRAEYDDTTRKLVAEIYSADIEAFGFDF